MNKERLIKVSKWLSFVLRHHPESCGVELDPSGWAAIADLIDARAQQGAESPRNHPQALSAAEILDVVKFDSKQRFAVSKDAKRIRANQGHSFEVDLGLERVEPPELLFHGTVEAAWLSIEREGLKPSGRQFVHLSAQEDVAKEVGARRGTPVILKIQARELHSQGHHFWISANDVWLTKSIPASHINRPEL